MVGSKVGRLSRRKATLVYVQLHLISAHTSASYLPFTPRSTPKLDHFNTTQHVYPIHLQPITRLAHPMEEQDEYQKQLDALVQVQLDLPTRFDRTVADSLV